MPEINKETFGKVDYIIFAVMLGISAAIGIFYAFRDRKKNNTQEFLMGGRSMAVFPVAMSVLSSFMSAVTLLGSPAEVYRFGCQYVVINIAFCLVVPATAYLYVPVFYNLGITSAYEYLELRFHRSLRSLGALVFSLGMLMYMPVVLYAPSLALSEVTGISIWVSVLSVGLVCTFYTSIGGIKAVVWTDLFQSLMMYCSILLVVVKGSYDLGGIGVVWERNVHGQRIVFENFFDMDPTVRHTFWSLVIGGYVLWMGNYAANQTMIQRYLTIGTLRGAQACIWINMPALVILNVLTVLAGLVIYAHYWTCDPIGTKLIYAPDQLFPRFVMETLGAFPGVPGLFVSGILSGALSTVSSGVNSLAAVTLEDFVKKFISKDINETTATRVTKGLAVFYGLVSIALVLVAQQLGGVLQAALAMLGIVGGPMLGIFTLGMFLPWANAKGAFVGLLTGFASAMWLGMGAFVKAPYNPEAPRSYENCTEDLLGVFQNSTLSYQNQTIVTFDEIGEKNDHIFVLYRLSYLWLSGVGFIVVVIVGFLVSLITGPNKRSDVDDRLISPLIPWIYGLLPGGRSKSLTFAHKKPKGTSMTTLTAPGVISDEDFYPTKKITISDTDLRRSKPC